MAKYKFILSSGLTQHIAIPIWKSDMAKEYAFEQGQMFRRAALSDALVFLKDDYTWIMSQPFERKIVVTLQVDWDEDGTFVNYWRGSFHRTDCTINVDDMKVKVKPVVEDRYNKILAALDKEYDLVRLSPANQPVQMKRRPMFQVYTIGESVVSCFLGGMAWEQEVSGYDFTQSELEDDCHFGHIGDIIQVSFSNAPAGLQDGFFGMWDYGRYEGEWDCFASDQSTYRMTYFQAIENNMYANGLRIYPVNGDAVYWEFRQAFPWDIAEPDVFYHDIPDTFTMTAKQSGISNLSASWVGAGIFGRWLLGREFQNSYEIPSNDLVINNRNYRWCYPYINSGIVRTTNRSDSNPTQYGIRPDGRYYLKPLLTRDELLVCRGLYPIARSTWSYASIWLDWSEGMAYTEESFMTDMTLRDAYTLEAVIKALLSQIDTALTFEADAAHSQFLYGTNPLSNSWGRLVMTPKTNVLVAEYTQPAQTAPVTLGEVLNMLKNACGCYWYIDDNYRLRIEHVSYFKNGMSYSGTPSVGIDVTELYNSRNGHSWSLGTGEYSFDKMQMPERYEYSWMDDSTQPFKGDAIEVISTFVQQGNIEEVSIAMFNSDVDYMMLNPSGVSEDGFALLCCTVTGTTYSLPFATQEIGEYTLTMQNYMLAMVNLQPAFLISDMPSWNIKVNGVAATAKGIQRMKKQQLKVPVGNTDGDIEQLIRTTVGDGEVERMSVSLTSRTAKYNLRFDTTEQPT